VPWGFAAVFVFVPLLLLAIRIPLVALPLLALSAAAPVLYLRFERQKR
jgi:Flp pilus assembly protein TadB